MMVIRGKSYRTFPATTVQLRVLRRLKAEFGFGWATVQEYLAGVDDDTDIGDMLGDEQFLAWMWVWVLNAGDEMSREELESLTLAEVDFTREPPPAASAGEDDADPTSARTGSAPGDAAARRPRRSPGSRTSRPRSTGGSS